MGRWSKVEAMLDKEVQREIKRVLNKAKSAMGLSNGHGNGNGHTKPITAKARKLPRGNPPRARVWQGRYMGLMRSLSAADKAKVKKMREDKGIAQAIAEAKRLRASA